MKRALLVAAILGACAACPDDPRAAESTKVVARVGDVEIKEGQLLSALAQRGVPRIPDPSSRLVVAQTVVEGLVEEELLVAGARRAGIQVTDDDVEREIRARAEGYPTGMFPRVLVAEQLTIDDLRAKVRRRLLGDAFLHARLATLPPVPEEDVRAVYAAKVAGVVRPPAVRARQILLRTEEEAKHLLGELRAKKTTFEAAAQKFSAGPEAQDGGDLGWFAQGELPKVFDLCFLLQKDQISDVVSSEYGFHIFQVVETRAEGPEPFEAARARIEADLQRERRTKAVADVVAELRRTIPVVVNQDAVARVVARIPAPPAEPPAPEPVGEAGSRALDAHGSVDPLKEAPKPSKNGASP